VNQQGKGLRVLLGPWHIALALVPDYPLDREAREGAYHRIEKQGRHIIGLWLTLVLEAFHPRLPGSGQRDAFGAGLQSQGIGLTVEPATATCVSHAHGNHVFAGFEQAGWNGVAPGRIPAARFPHALAIDGGLVAVIDHAQMQG
jgi:hypothetical protein